MMAHGTMVHLDGWMPVRLAWNDGEDEFPRVEWIRLGQQRFTESFFEDTIQSALRHPFHHAFRRTTGLDALESWSLDRPGLAPAGFVFHMSRCGSTLLSQVLASIERNIVLSEASPLDSILRAHHRNPVFTPDLRSRALQWMLSALGQKRHPAEEQVFVKFDCWNIPELAVVRNAFPTVPWIFLYRDPLEVLVSQMRQRAVERSGGAFSCGPGPIDRGIGRTTA